MFERVKQMCRTDVLLPLLIAAAAAVAWVNRFVQDDAFISFRYAKNLAEGNGLVWNVGQPAVEGFSSPLWMGLLSLGASLGLDLALWARWLGVAAAATLGLANAMNKVAPARWADRLAALKRSWRREVRTGVDDQIWKAWIAFTEQASGSMNAPPLKLPKR